jgi:hypothetical protein
MFSIAVRLYFFQRRWRKKLGESNHPGSKFWQCDSTTRMVEHSIRVLSSVSDPGKILPGGSKL